MSTYQDTVIEHYETVAKEFGLSERSTMGDTTTRRMEIEAITTTLDRILKNDDHLLEIGCGNGVLLAELRERYPTLRLTGRDFSKPMVELAKSRDIANADVDFGDVRKLDAADGHFDVIVGERVVINLMDKSHQKEAYAEIARVLKPGGYYVCIEAFMDGLATLNEARVELGLDPNEVAYHNLWFEESHFQEITRPHFELIDSVELAGVPRHFLSSYYFMSRVVYPSVTRSDLKYNTHFVRFFADVAPRGTYSPIQFLLFRKAAD